MAWTKTTLLGVIAVAAIGLLIVGVSVSRNLEAQRQEERAAQEKLSKMLTFDPSKATFFGK